MVLAEPSFKDTCAEAILAWSRQSRASRIPAAELSLDGLGRAFFYRYLRHPGMVRAFPMCVPEPSLHGLGKPVLFEYLRRSHLCMVPAKFSTSETRAGAILD